MIYNPAKSANLVIYDWVPVTWNRKRQVKIMADVNTEPLGSCKRDLSGYLVKTRDRFAVNYRHPRWKVYHESEVCK